MNLFDVADLVHAGRVMLFWALALAVLLAPLWPAWREWRHPTDDLPLPVVRHHSGDARNFAAHFMRWLDEHASERLAWATSHGDNSGVIAMGRQTFRLLGAPDSWLAQQHGQRITEGLLAQGALHLPAGTQCQWEVASPIAVTVGEGCALRAVASGGPLTLGERSQVLRWADAAEVAHVHAHAVLAGRLTAGQAVVLAPGVQFTRLSAPRITVEGPAIATVVPTPAVDWAPDRGEAMDKIGRTWRYPAALRLEAGAVVRQHLVVDGDLHIGHGAQVHGDLKVHGRLSTDEGVHLHGSLVVTGDAHLGAHSRLKGPVVCEGILQAGLGVRFGTPDHTTTLTARRIQLAQGVSVYGSVWARELGLTETA